MALEKYISKRDAKKTPEPFGGKSKEQDVLRYVIQKHAASHLHYDFRLEMEGVLKSWAVPKGPSTDPDVKRLAMMVEDHPFDYRSFEGIIPQGQYGGGTVIVWDEGTYVPADFKASTKKELEKQLLYGLHSGKLKFVLKGKKLKGEFALVKAYGRGENGWLLMKITDKYASTDDVTKKDKSVISKKTLEQVAATSDNIYGAEKKAKPKVSKSKQAKAEPTAKKNDASQQQANVPELLKKGKREKMPTGVMPMLATLADAPFDKPDWRYEVKWDGYRSLAYVNKGKVELTSRNNKSFTEKYYPLTEAMKGWPINVVLDGEILVIKDDGTADFSALQNWRSEADGHLVYYAFDLLWYDGKNIMALPLSERQAVLEQVLPTDNDIIRLSQVFVANGLEFFAAAAKMGLEGIMAKQSDSPYIPDSRSKQWLKIKANQRQEVIIAGYTKNEDSAKPFSSLLLGVYDKGKLRYAGKVGTGFTEKMQRELLDKFKPLIRKKSAFAIEPDINKPSRFQPKSTNATATWLDPSLICEVSYTEVTSDGVFRHPSFKGMRTDKTAKEVVMETPADTDEIVHEKNKFPKKGGGSFLVAPGNGDRKTLLNPNDETQVRIVKRHELKFTNLSKIYWPEDGYTKRDMFNYYYQIADYILPYLKDRPQSLNRFPNGIHGPSFYQKDVKGKAPDWVKTFPYTTSDGEHKEFLVGDDEATLLWMASLGSIEMNPWFSRIQHPDDPDYCVIDLDPDKNTFDQVITAAQEVKKILDALGVPGFAKTSGSTGIHIYIPLGAKYTYDQSQLFAKLIVTLVHRQIPKFTSMERMIKNRGGKMYLDFLQNRPGATIACPYSLRPKVGATVSMPLHWEEIKKGLSMKDFTIENAVARARSEGDLFKGSLGSGIDMAAALENAQRLFS
jgi:bifunctional non-homologous end joining protein LigD